MSFLYADVTALIKTKLPQAVVEDFMAMVQTDYGACVDQNYDQDTADKLKTYMTAYMLDKLESNGRVTSKRAANGASVSIAQEDESNFSSNPYGFIISSFDKNGCWMSLLESKSGFIFSYDFESDC